MVSIEAKVIDVEEDADRYIVSVRFDGVLPDGQGIDEVMARPEYEIQVGLGRGDAHAELFASDLGHGYVSVNADYRT